MWRLKLLVLRTKCWFVGHDERPSDPINYEEAYCARCYVDWPQEKTTLPDLLNVVYYWLAERNWKWYERLDSWLYENYDHVLPDWWSY